MPCSRKSAIVDPRTGFPSSSIEPSSARSRPVRTFASSVRPAPDSPQMPRISPRRASKCTSWKKPKRDRPLTRNLTSPMERSSRL